MGKFFTHRSGKKKHHIQQSEEMYESKKINVTHHNGIGSQQLQYGEKPRKKTNR